MCLLVDDHSSDGTVELAKRLGLQYYVHDQNYGYGRNQQTCYREALAAGADVIIMVHPDYQYTPLLVTAMASMVAYGVYDVVLGSRILGGQALRGGMPIYKYIANRLLTAFENLFLRSSFPSTTLVTAPSAAKCSLACPCSRTPMTFFLTIKRWHSVRTSASASARFPVRRNILMRRHLSTSAAA